MSINRTSSIKDPKTKMYDVVLIVDGREKEIIHRNMPIALARFKAKQAANSTHRNGKVITREKE